MCASPDLRAASEQVVAWARRLVSTPSEQSDRFEQDPAVQAFLGGPVCEILREAGVEPRRDGFGNVIAETGDRGPGLVVMAYAMTHPANRMSKAFSADLVSTSGGTAIRGRGAAEQKGALTAAIAAFGAAHASGAGGRLTLIVSAAGETGTHDAAKVACASIAPGDQAAIVAIGTGGRTSLGNKGRIDVDITVRGRASHSSTPWAGIDAIRGARKVMDLLDAIDLSTPTHGGLGAATLTPTSISSAPKATHTIQDEVRLTVDRRLLPGQSPDAAFEEICVAVSAAGPGDVSCALTRLQMPAEIATDSPLMKSIAAGCAALGRPAPDVFYSHGCVDAGYLLSLGMAPTMWGPGEQALWHADDEYVLVEDIIAGAEAYLATFRAYSQI
jgi:acetylornithine deacetylase